MKTSAKLFVFAFLALATACGGGGGGGGGIPSGGGTPPPPPPTQTPGSIPLQAGTPTPVPTVTPLAQNTEAPPSATSQLPSSWGRIAPIQVFDYFPTTKAGMTNAQITTDAHAYPMVWGSFNPQPWTANPTNYSSRYYVPAEDSNLISGLNLAWFQANHPDWILYTCDTNNNPTDQIAYFPGIGFPDVPLDIQNSNVINYQINSSLIPYLKTNGYKAAALDQISFKNIMIGGNPQLGQQIHPGYYACGIWTNGPSGPGTTFVRRYQSKTDPQYATDMLNWLTTASHQLHASGLKMFVNHTVQSQTDPNELALLNLVDMELDETGFSDYGYYVLQGDAGLFAATVSWMKFLQSHNIAIGIIDKYEANHETAVTPNELEYSIATYLMGDEQGAYLFTNPANGTTYGYGTEQWHNEFYAPIGVPCGEMRRDATNQQIYYRQFSGGLAVVNSGSLPIASEPATLPANHTYTDIEGRAVTNPLSVASNDAYVLLTGNNQGCL